MEMCITPHSAMDNTIHSIWKSKSSFPTSCKQCCPQLHKTGSYTHCPQCRRRRNPSIPSYLVLKNIKKSLQIRPCSCNIVYKSVKKGVPKHPHFLNPLAKFAVLVYNHLRSRRILACPTVAQSETYKA